MPHRLKRKLKSCTLKDLPYLIASTLFVDNICARSACGDEFCEEVRAPLVVHMLALHYRGLAATFSKAFCMNKSSCMIFRATLCPNMLHHFALNMNLRPY